jgi:DNA-binding SARP family transcriptional activator
MLRTTAVTAMHGPSGERWNREAVAAVVTLRTLGHFSVAVGSTQLESPSTHKARALLAFLAMHPGCDLPRERLMETFWPGVDPGRARDSLNTALHAVRRCFRAAGLIPDGFLIATRSVVRWIAETDLDADRLTSLEASPAGEDVEAALAEYRGEFLAGCYDDWSVEQRERLSALHERALRHAVCDLGDAEAARTLLELNPYEESAYLLLLDSEASAGRTTAATALAGRCRFTFAESRCKPSADLERKLEEIPSWGHDEPALAFVGRERERAAVEHALVAAQGGRGVAFIVHGEAGIGKTAFVDRCTRRALAAGIRVAGVQCVADDPRRFGPWAERFALGAHDTATKVAEAISRRVRGRWLLTVDDAHQLDAESLGVFAMVANLASSLGCVVIATARSEGYARLQRRLQEARTEMLALGALSHAEVLRGLRMAGIVDEAFAEAIYRRSGGNPLFVNGFLRGLAAEGKIVRKAHGWVPREAALQGDISLPTSLAQLVADRLLVRGRDAALVACALALEPAGDAEDLAYATELTTERVLDAIDDLLALGILWENSSAMQLAFRHDLYAEVAKDLASPSRRSQMRHYFAERSYAAKFGGSLRSA